MTPRSFFRLLPLAAAVLAVGGLIGCGEGDSTGTRGELGTLSFEYSTGVCGGCAMDREVLVGSVLEIDMYGISPRVDYAVRSTASNVADFQSTSRCVHGLEDCQNRITMITKTAGDVSLEIFDDWTGTVRDRVTIKVRDAAALDTVVRSVPSRDGRTTTLEPNEDGAFEVKVNSNIEIVSTARSATGNVLIATSDAIKGAYADEGVLGPVPTFLGAAPTEYAKAKNPGVTSVAVVGGGARQELSFRVVQ